VTVEDFLDRIGEHAPDPILITEAGTIEAADGGPRIVWCNPAFTELTGYTLDEVAGQTPRMLQGPDTDRAELDRIRAALEGGAQVRATLRNYTKARQPYDVEVFITPVRDADGATTHFMSVQRDVTERARRERTLAAQAAALEASQRQLQEEQTRLAGLAAVAEHAQELITITDLDFRILWANPAFAARAGFPAATLRGLQHCDIVSKTGETYPSRHAAAKAVLKGSYESGLTRNIDRQGNTFWTDVRISLLRDEQGRPERFVVIERDVTTEVRQREEMTRRAEDAARAAAVDPLTGMLTRQGFEGALALLCADAELHDHGVALLLVDFDQLKAINDTLGHAAGDEILTTVAGRLERLLSPDVLVGRVGGDEFGIAMTLRADRRDLAALGERILREAGQAIVIGEAAQRVALSVGYTWASRAPFDIGRMMIEADVALAAAKADPARRVHPFDGELAARQCRRKTLADELHVAIENGDFVCHYQPQIDAQTGALTGVEALVRWENPRLGLLTSDAFVPLAAELSLEHRIDRAAMEIALQDRARWQAYGLAVPKVSVNISALRLLQPDLDQELAGLDLASGALSFELLESISLEVADDRIAWSLDMLRERGIGIEIDDFGTGRASVNGLLRVGPDRLKIDRSLIAPADVDTTRRRIFELLVEAGRTLGIPVTAEGVENEEHARIARQAGCSVLQGFLYDGPLTPATLLARYGQMQVKSV
jgi:diguanylate cyclase (GGDEF)-like protein/PAS domain S-box-containing protein